MSVSTAQGSARLQDGYQNAVFDGRYVYFVPFISITFVRFDTQGTFTNVSDWQRMSTSTAHGGMVEEEVCRSAAFDGRYVYFAPYAAATFVRFDTQGTFTNSSDWQQMSMSTAQGGTALGDAYDGMTFDGRYVYFTPKSSDTFVKFDTQGTFTNASDWQQMSMSTAQGGTTLNSAYIDATFDGRYIYFVPMNADTFVRFAGMQTRGW